MTRTKDEIETDALDLAELLDIWAENTGAEGGINALLKGGQELVATLAHLFDVHEQDFGATLNAAAKQYVEEKMAMDPEFADAHARAKVAREAAMQAPLINLDDLAKELGIDLSEAVES